MSNTVITLLEELPGLISAVDPKDFINPNNPVAQNETVIGEADDYAKKLYTLYIQFRTESVELERGTLSERAYLKAITLLEEKSNIIYSLMWIHIAETCSLSMKRDIETIALRSDFQVVTVKRGIFSRLFERYLYVQGKIWV